MNCDQVGCNEEAVGAFSWPGRHGPLAACSPHYLKAHQVAWALGFVLPDFTLARLVELRARDSLKRLSPPGTLIIPDSLLNSGKVIMLGTKWHEDDLLEMFR